MTRRQKIAIVLALLFVIIVLIILWLLRTQPEPVAPATIVVTEQEEEPAQPAPPAEEQVEQEVRIETASIQSLAKTFAERYGSFSTEANFANLVDVMPLMTDAFEAETQNFIETAAPAEEFYGVNTKVITLAVDELDDEAGYAKVSLTTQREEAIGSPQNVSTRFQDIVLEFAFIAGEWKVSSAEWL